MSERWPDKIVVGLTGNIATGKTTVLRLAEERGALALDADDVVHQILATDPAAQLAIVDTFGPHVRQTDGEIDRGALGAVVFNDQDALARLEQILHPRVRSRLFKRIDHSPQAIVFIEAIKLLEGGLAAACDQVWVTRCPRAMQVERLMRYRNLDEETALMRISAQSSQELKVAAADVVIDTDGSLEETEIRFWLAWRLLQRRLLVKASPAKADNLGKSKQGQDQGHLWAEDRNDWVTREEPQMKAKAHPAEARNTEIFGQGIVVRRAQPADEPAMIDVVKMARHDSAQSDQDHFSADFGQRGYLIGQQDDQVSAIAGWNADNLVATIDCLYVYPREAIAVTGAAVLQEIEVTANELTCEVILALPGDEGPIEIRQLLAERGYSYVLPTTLPRVWQEAIPEALERPTTVMMKVLRDTREVHVRTIEEYDG